MSYFFAEVGEPIGEESSCWLNGLGSSSKIGEQQLKYSGELKTLWHRTIEWCREEGGFYLLNLMAVVSALIVLLKLWNWSASVPLSLGGDGNFQLILINNLIKGGTAWTNSTMGAPENLSLYHFPPVGETIHIWMLHLLGLVTRDAVKTQTLFYFASFITTSFTAQLAARMSGVSRKSAWAVGVLFAFLPYHFMRNVNHLELSSYFTLPLILVAILVLINRATIWSGRRTCGVLVLLGAIAGGTGLYYAIFSAVMVVIVSSIFAMNKGSWKRFLRNICCYLISMCLMVAYSIVPMVLYFRHHTFPRFERDFVNLEYYGLKIANLFLPIPNHRLGFFRSISSLTTPSAVPGEGTEMIGMVAVCGVIILVGVVFKTINSSYVAREKRENADSIWIVFAVTTCVALLIATVAGLSSIFYIVGLRQIRCWNRLSPLIALIGLIAIFIFVERVVTHHTRLKLSGRLFICVPILIVLFGLWDQTSPSNIPAYSTVTTEWNADSRYVATVDRKFSRGDMILQLPEMVFPENGPIFAMPDYAQAVPYIHNTRLRWSYGLAKNEVENWDENQVVDNFINFVSEKQKMGFVAIEIDTRGFSDGGLSVIEKLKSLGAKQTVKSENGFSIVFDLRTVSK